MDLNKALDYAESKDLDLVEVAPGQDIPVCKVMNYGKYKYEQSRKEEEAKKKQKIVDIKEIDFHLQLTLMILNLRLKMLESS